jgi:hypothetical protein
MGTTLQPFDAAPRDRIIGYRPSAELARCSSAAIRLSSSSVSIALT